MVTERFPLPPPELRSGGDDLYDYLYQTAERLNLLLQDMTGTADDSGAGALEATLSAREIRALVQRSLQKAAFSGEQIAGGAIRIGQVSLTGAVNAPVTVGDGTGMATAALSVTGGPSAIDLGGETLAQYVNRMVNQT
ncbi:MAG: hypothetical protein IJS55_03985 [Oscillospiraceae bacterium]|nr:hypothetical protein [Oscillospiraceae bacterium]